MEFWIWCPHDAVQVRFFFFFFFFFFGCADHRAVSWCRASVLIDALHADFDLIVTLALSSLFDLPFPNPGERDGATGVVRKSTTPTPRLLADQIRRPGRHRPPLRCEAMKARPQAMIAATAAFL